MYGVPQIYQDLLNEAINVMVTEQDEELSVNVLEVAQFDDEQFSPVREKSKNGELFENVLFTESFKDDNIVDLRKSLD